MTAAQRNAARRQQRRRRSQASLLGWISVGVVVVVVAVFVVIKLTGSSSPPKSSANGVTSGQDPLPAPASVTGPLASVPLSVFDSVGTAGMGVPMTVTANQATLKSSGLPRFVYEGAEFCPYCAMERWPMVVALNRFGSFTGLKLTSSSSTDDVFPNTPTLSFLGSTYKSKYLVFNAYEDEDRNENPLQVVPSDVTALYAKYDGNGETGTVFDSGAGIPFIDIANHYVSAGDPDAYDPVGTALEGNALTHQQIAEAIKDPTSAVGTTMGAKYLIADANFLSAAICSVDGNLPATVCTSSGVQAAASALKSSKPVS
jgi:hypothetical protein